MNETGKDRLIAVLAASVVGLVALHVGEHLPASAVPMAYAQDARPLVTPGTATAPSATLATTATTAPQMAVDKNIVYRLQNGELSAYTWDSADIRPLIKQLGTMKFLSKVPVVEPTSIRSVSQK